MKQHPGCGLQYGADADHQQPADTGLGQAFEQGVCRAYVERL